MIIKINDIVGKENFHHAQQLLNDNIQASSI